MLIPRKVLYLSSAAVVLSIILDKSGNVSAKAVHSVELNLLITSINVFLVVSTFAILSTFERLLTTLSTLIVSIFKYSGLNCFLNATADFIYSSQPRQHVLPGSNGTH